MNDWVTVARELDELAQRQLFFVGGAPRSGTTWLQQILDTHPDACCRGEGLFLKTLVTPLEKLVADRKAALHDKNRIFPHTRGYPVPEPAHAEHLAATAILLALRQQTEGRAFKAVGEKTPENVFLFARLARLFPAARFVAIARDPRDVLASAWHFFHRGRPQDDSAMEGFLTTAFPSLNEGARCMLAFADSRPDRYLGLTYEGLRAEPAAQVTGLYRFLGLAHDDALVARCVAATSFPEMTKGQQVGQGSFFRRVGSDWRETISPRLNELVLRELGWMFPHFGWRE